MAKRGYSNKPSWAIPAKHKRLTALMNADMAEEMRAEQLGGDILDHLSPEELGFEPGTPAETARKHLEAQMREDHEMAYRSQLEARNGYIRKPSKGNRKTSLDSLLKKYENTEATMFNGRRSISPSYALKGSERVDRAWLNSMHPTDMIQEVVPQAERGLAAQMVNSGWNPEEIGLRALQGHSLEGLANRYGGTKPVAMGKAFAESGGTPLSSFFKPGNMVQEMEVGALPAELGAVSKAGKLSRLAKLLKWGSKL